MSRRLIRDIRMTAEQHGYVVSVEEGHHVPTRTQVVAAGQMFSMPIDTGDELEWRWREVYRGQDRRRAEFTRDLYKRSA